MSQFNAQHKLVLATEKLPRELDGVFDAETYEKSRAYQIDKHGYSFWHGLFHMAHLTVSSGSVTMAGESDIAWGTALLYKHVQSLRLC